jgi:hypothetical protein
MVPITKSFVPMLIQTSTEQAITELVENDCAYEVPFKPFAVNPLSVAINKSEKKRLILDLSVLNKFAKKEKFKFKEWKTVVQFFNKDMFFFFMNIDCCLTALGLKWSG